MKERGMIFNTDMVRAVLSGRKTQTRRIIKNQRVGDNWSVQTTKNPRFKGHTHDWWLPTGTQPYSALPACPFGAVGDRLWVRETWQAIHDSLDEFGNVDERTWMPSIPKATDSYWHAVYAETFGESNREDRGFPWRPAIHMPRWASRITLEITGVRVERLNDINEDDARAEGVHWSDGNPNDVGLATGLVENAREEFAHLWCSIYGPESWQASPWVWAIEFQRVEGGAS